MMKICRIWAFGGIIF